MALASFRIMIATALAVTVACASAQGAQAQERATRDPDDNIVSELIVVAPTGGPAWWKASKGDSVVWIMGLPPKAPERLSWDSSALRRRLKGARLMLGVFVESSGFDRGVRPPNVPKEMEEKVRAAGRLLGKWLPEGMPISVATVISFRGTYYGHHRLSFHIHNEIMEIGHRARVPLVTPPKYIHFWGPNTLAPENPATARCIEGLIAETTEPPERYRQAARYWAVGDVRNMLAIAPKGNNHACEQLWPNHWERTIAFQTSLTAQALERPGKVVAVSYISQLVAEDGILQRLRAQGYTIADPSQPLEE